jgi:PLP dependent protein
MTVADRLAEVRRAIDEELARCGRDPGSVRIVGVSKKQSPQAIAQAVSLGLRDVGENYVQEAHVKFRDATLAQVRSEVRIHYVGHIQTNKARQIAEFFDVVQSVDRLDAATALGQAAFNLGKRLQVLLQLNISPTQRHGCPPEEAERLAEAIRAEDALALDGVMAIGPVTEDPAALATAFSIAAKTFARVGGSTLSIGMSGDWRVAVRAGSTMVRIGTAIFGPRAKL